MRLPKWLTFALGALVCAPLARAQEAKYWPLNKISFPVDLAEFNKLNPKPVSILFYSAPAGGKFTLVYNRKPGELDEIIDTKDPASTPRRGFTYPATADGEEEFAVQYEYADGSRTPAKLSPQYRIKFDTRPPGVKAVATGGNSVRWLVTDENLVRESIRVEGRFVGNEKWEFLNTGELKDDDSFKWDVPPGKTLEVRVYARDRAGHENRSLPVKLAGGIGGRIDDRVKPGGGAAPAPPGSFGDPVKTTPGGKVGTGFGGIDELPVNRPKIEYVSTNKLRVTSKVTHITRSGVKAAQLFALEPTSGADWKAVGDKKNLTITPESLDAERFVSIDYDAPRDGLYGFVLQPISGAGTKQEDPRAGDTPQYLVYVDTTMPEFKFNNVNVLGGGLNGPLVEILWEAKDSGSGFQPEPIVLEYSEDGQKWKAITAKTANTGRYTWEITDKKLWKFFVRGTATDMAGNMKLLTHSDDKGTPTPVMVDLDKPSGNVDKVNPNGPASVPKGINSDFPGMGGGGVTGVSAPPDKLPGFTPINNPKLIDPPPAIPTTRPGVTPIPGAPPIPDLDKKVEPKPIPPPKPADPKKPDDKKKIDVEMPGVQPINITPLPDVTALPGGIPAVVPLPPALPPIGEPGK